MAAGKDKRKGMPRTAAVVIGEKSTTIGTSATDAVMVPRMEGLFPPVQSIIPNKESRKEMVKVEFDAALMAEVLASLAKLSANDYNRVRLSLSVEKEGRFAGEVIKPILLEVMSTEDGITKAEAMVMPLA